MKSNKNYTGNVGHGKSMPAYKVPPKRNAITWGHVATSYDTSWALRSQTAGVAVSTRMVLCPRDDGAV